jgi:asparagine synthase (glutamine-hydrolysing)
MDNFIRNLGYEKYMEIINSGNLHKYINLEYIEKIVSNHFNNIDNNTYKLWQIIFLHFWIEENE